METTRRGLRFRSVTLTGCTRRPITTPSPPPDEKTKIKDEKKELVGEKEKPSRAKRDMKK